jgi:hypothetical protein
VTATPGRSRRDIECLEALLDAHAETPGEVDAIAVLEATGLDVNGARHWLPADLGFTPQGLQGGHRRLDLAEFAAAVRHFAGERIQ